MQSPKQLRRVATKGFIVKKPSIGSKRRLSLCSFAIIIGQVPFFLWQKFFIAVTLLSKQDLGEWPNTCCLR